MPRADVNAAASRLLEKRGALSTSELGDATGLTRQALHRHLSRWVNKGELVREGRGRATRYRRPGSGAGPGKTAPGFERTYGLEGLADDAPWIEFEAWLEGSAPHRSAAASGVLETVLTELVNNAIEHSGSAGVTLRAHAAGERVALSIKDDGVGVFERLRSGLDLEDHVHAVQELAKAGVSTSPERHNGEGLFFSSQMVALLEVDANGLEWIVDTELGDQALFEVPPSQGTEVRVSVSLRSTTTPEEVFARHSTGFEFDTTCCAVRLFEHGARFVSRSQARRLVAGLERFREVTLDFKGVEGVGQGFVDEVFRVWAAAHPRTRLTPENMNRSVEFMIRRGLRWPDGTVDRVLSGAARE